VIVGLGLFMAPHSLRMLQISVWSFIAAFVAQMPANPNHRWVLFFIALSFAKRIHSIDGVGNLSTAVKGSLRWITVVVYLFAALAKLNTTYLDPTTSCASVFSTQTFFLYRMGSISHEALLVLIAHFSAIAELLIPLLLLWPRSRQLGVVCGIAFHIFLALNFTRYFGNFSAAMFVLLVSWLPEECCTQVCSFAERYLHSIIRVWVFSLMLTVVLSLAMVVSPLEHVVARHILFMGYAVSLLVLAIRSAPGVICKERVGRPSFLVLGLAILNACTPYLGIKTRSALTMYSNLRIEPDYSNHLFMPPCPDPFGYLSDRVEIVQTTHQGLRQRLEQSNAPELPYIMPYISLCAFMACQDDLCSTTNDQESIVYRRGGVPFTHKLDQELPPDCPPWIARKLLFFGPIGPNSERVCIW